MSKRLQVLLEEDDLERIREAARSRRMTVSEWVRQVARNACREEPSREIEKKIGLLRRAARHNAPTADIDRMLREIEEGYLKDFRDIPPPE